MTIFGGLGWALAAAADEGGLLPARLSVMLWKRKTASAHATH